MISPILITNTSITDNDLRLLSQAMNDKLRTLIQSYAMAIMKEPVKEKKLKLIDGLIHYSELWAKI